MEKIWYFKKQGGKACGPVDQAALQRLAASGQIAADDIVWRTGTALRVLAKNVGGLDKYYPPKPEIRGREVQTTYGAPVRSTKPASQTRTAVLSVMPTHLDPAAIQKELVVVVKTLIMAAIIVIISMIYHLFKQQ